MKNTLAIIGKSTYDHYLKPMPQVIVRSIVRAVLTHLISTTVSLIVVAIIQAARGREESTT